LLVFGFVKARFTGINPLRGGIQTALIGGLAAAVAFAIARAIG
jgi:VIT1/CCC1 family predicted Fe2+/Mn2+ transporter